VTGSPDGSLKDKTVLVVGRGSGLARAIALAAVDAGARVVAAGRDQETLPVAYAGEPGVSTEMVDLTDEASVAALGERLGTVDHVVSTASARVRGRLADLDRDAIRLSFDTKVIGPLMLAKHLAPRMNEGGSFVIFSGVAAAKIAVGTMGVAITNAAADTLARSLALELAPIRVNAISPGRDRHRRLGRPRRAGQGGLLRRHQRPQSGPADRHPPGHCPGRPVRHDQHVPDRPDAAHRRRRAADLIPLRAPHTGPGLPRRRSIMGLSWQQGPLALGAIGRFLVPDPLPGRLLYAEPLRRRMRVRVSGVWIADSEEVTLLHEPGRYPVAYFPAGGITDGVLEPGEHITRHQDLGATSWYTVRVGEHRKPRAAWQHTELPGYASELKGRIAFAWRAMDAFYEEDERIVGHADLTTDEVAPDRQP
jgi:NAD(P)-dependent dehydrogenase (short-subunit alcohol dehydrogenase family)/uncharacterized protein (DUF427 family)